MKKILIFIITFFLLLSYVNAETDITPNSKSAILIEQSTGSILYEKNPDEKLAPASMTKVMSMLLIMEAIDSGKLNMTDVVTISENASNMGGSQVFLEAGEKYSVEELLKGVAIASGNDAVVALSEKVAGGVEEFVNMMNKKAVEIGMKNTTFNNPNGLDEEGGNLSTAYDMALLTSYAMKNEQYKEIVSTKKYTLKTNMNYYSWINKHKLLHSYKYATGGKTGFTEIAKRTLVTTASKDNINLVAVTLNDGNDFQDHIDLFEEAFENYTNYNILKKGNINILNEEYYENDTLYIENDYNITLQNKNNNVILNYKIEKKDNYNDKDIVGKIEVKINDEIVHEENIYVKKGITLSFLDKVKNWFKNLW